MAATDFGRKKGRGEQAIAYLNGEDKYADRRHFPLPCLIVTDLKMPGVDGFELLKWLRDQPAFEPVPKIVLTASAHEEDKKRARELGCAAYFTKPSQLAGLVNLVTEMNAVWISQHCPVPSQALTSDLNSEPLSGLTR